MDETDTPSDDKTVEVSLTDISTDERALAPIVGQCAIVSVGACFTWSRG